DTLIGHLFSPDVEVTAAGQLLVDGLSSGFPYINGSHQLLSTGIGQNVNFVLNGAMDALAKVTTVTGNYTALGTDNTILINAIGSTTTLPNANIGSGKIYFLKLIHASTTATVSAGQNIDASTTYSLSAQYKYVTVQSDGAQWWVIANN
ncbi:MAG TPA: hypothetical protein VH598_06175, partial [Verrucomicrobiae bacterium]|nr:hypothetical protein [Verrucomicrobiae bacterium]